MTSPALALDEFLRAPGLPATLDTMRARAKDSGYAWLLDQSDAAARHTQEYLRDLAHTNDGQVLPVPVTAQPDWVRLPLLATLADWIAGKARLCTHSPDPRRPRPVVAAAWKPGLIACKACVHLISLAPRSPKNWTCDGCGTVVDPDNDGRVWAAVASYGMLAYHFGACVGCRYWDEP